MDETKQQKESRFDTFLRNHAPKIYEINKKYATPKIKMTKSVRFALLMLRVYLIFLVCLLAYRFIILVHG